MLGNSGMNAVAHAVEALYAKHKNPIISLMGSEAIAALARALPRITTSRTMLRHARMRCTVPGFAALAGNGWMALHHKLCHVLGGHRDAHGLPLASRTPPLVFTSWPAGSALHEPLDEPTAARRGV